MLKNPISKYFFLFLLLSPGLWQIGLHADAAVKEWVTFPGRISQNIHAKEATPFFSYIDELRWGGRSLHRNDLKSRLLYNKSAALANEAFDFLQFATPKLYFAVGDGSVFSPARIEPIASLLFPVWLAGILSLLAQHRYRVFLLLALGLLPAYLAGSKNMSLLLLAMLVQIYIAAVGFTSIFTKFSSRIVASAFISVYGLYIVLMNLWFTR